MLDESSCPSPSKKMHGPFSNVMYLWFKFLPILNGADLYIYGSFNSDMASSVLVSYVTTLPSYKATTNSLSNLEYIMLTDRSSMTSMMRREAMSQCTASVFPEQMNQSVDISETAIFVVGPDLSKLGWNRSTGFAKPRFIM